MKNLAPIEFLRGYVALSIVSFTYGGLAIPLSILAGTLWMVGGTFNKIFRRLGIPALTTSWAIYQFGFEWSLLLILPLGFASLSIGDGFPDTRPTTLDEGSFLGRLVNHFVSDEDGGGEITKWLIVILFQIALIPIYVQ